VHSERLNSDNEHPMRNDGWESDVLFDQDRSDSNGSNHAPRHKLVRQLRNIAIKFRVLEFAISLGINGIAALISNGPVYQRPIPAVIVPINSTYTVYARDPTFDYKESDGLIKLGEPFIMIFIILPLVHIFINYIFPKIAHTQRIPNDTRDFALALIQSIGITTIFTQLLKISVGRLRPCFYNMCKWNYNATWDGKSNLCADAASDRQARMSFPSGHASYAMSSMFFLTLYLLGRSRLATNRNKKLSTSVWKNLLMFASFLPTVFGFWIAISRTQDNWHHNSDIVAGSLLGIMGAVFGYGFNYGSIFSMRFSGIPLANVNSELEYTLPTRSSEDCAVTTSIGSHHEGMRRYVSADTTV